MATTPDERVVLTLASDVELVSSRVFDAPLELVFRAFNDPTLVPRWWGPRGYTTVVEMHDARVGGKWRYLHQPPGGDVIAFSGEYREIVPPSRIARTFNFEPIGPGHEVLETVELEELEGVRTTMTTSMLFLSKADRDAMLESGMEGGYSESLARLDEVLDELKASA